MHFSLLLTISVSLFLFGYAVFRWNEERILTQGAISYIEARLAEIGNMQDIRNLSIAGAWDERWNRFLTSIIEPTATSGSTSIRSSLKPEELFSLSYTQKKFGFDLEAMASRASNLTGVGIAFTFLGLVVGVTSASSSLGSITSGHENDLLGMIEPLLQGAGLAFCTSLAGLTGSIGYSIGVQRNANALQSRVDSWNLKLGEFCPPISPSELQMIMISQSQKQADHIEQLPQRVAQGIGGSIAQIMREIEKREESSAKMMEDQLNGMITTITHNIEGMSESFDHSLESMSDGFSSSLDKLTKNFNRSIRQMAGNEMDQFAAQLKTLHTEYIDTLGLIIDRKNECLTEFSNQSLTALKQTSDISDLLEKSTTQIASMTGDVVDYVDDLKDKLDSLVTTELDASGEHLANTMEAIGSIITSKADIAGQILVAASEDSKKSLVSAASQLTANCSNASDSIAKGADTLSQSLESSGDAIAQKLAEGINTQAGLHFDEMKSGLDDHLQNQKEVWDNHEKALVNIYSSHQSEVQELDSRLADLIRKAQDSTNTYVEGLDQDAAKVLSTLSGSIDEMERIVQQLALVRIEQFSAEVS